MGKGWGVKHGVVETLRHRMPSHDCAREEKWAWITCKAHVRRHPDALQRVLLTLASTISLQVVAGLMPLELPFRMKKPKQSVKER